MIAFAADFRHLSKGQFRGREGFNFFQKIFDFVTQKPPGEKRVVTMRPLSSAESA
jgi:hypothetical protein